MDQIDQYLETAFAYGMLFLLVATPIVDGLHTAANAFKAHALTTPSESDDKIADKILSALASVTIFLDQVGRFVPTLRRGPKP